MQHSLNPGRAQWLLNRLRLMSPPEMLWRARQSVARRAGRAGLGLVPVPPRCDLTRPARAFVAPPPGIDAAPVLAAANAVLAGRWNVFALRADGSAFRRAGTAIRRPASGAARLRQALDYRDEAVVGDIKYLWEPNRHLQLVDARAGLRADAAIRATPSALRAAARQLVRRVPVPPRRELVERARAARPPRQLVDRLAALRRRRGAALRRRRRRSLSRALAGLGLPARAFHARPSVARTPRPTTT